LTGGNWKLQRSSEVKDNGTIISTAAYFDGVKDKDWIIATVPGTVLGLVLYVFLHK
jgi:uncharacterized membrane protein YdjX (TVP38/TMEM64 family)